MSDKENEQYLDEEYHFAEEPDMGIEVPSPSAETVSEPAVGATKKSGFAFNVEKVKTFFNETSPARNAVVLIGILIILFIVYKIISSLFFGGKNEVTLPKTSAKQHTVQNMTRPMQQPTIVATQAPATNQTAMLSDINTLKTRLAAVEQTQINLKDQMISMSNQLSSINANLNMLANKLTQMSQELTKLNVVVQEHAQQVSSFKVHLQSKPKITKHIYPHGPSVVYYLKAVIPGRAWLITNSGNTMTVRVGTPIPGYGVVRFIDAIQGRVLTSSGQLIRFSQDDS